MNTHIWYPLIKYWIEDKKRNGLTLPFLTGAALRGDTRKVGSEADVKAILDDMISNPVAGYVVEGRYCDNSPNSICAVVFMLVPKDSPQRLNDGYDLSPANGTEPTVAFDRNSALKLECSTAGDIKSKLIEDTTRLVSAGRFSRRWTDEGLDDLPFDEEDDEPMIDEALKKYGHLSST